MKHIKRFNENTLITFIKDNSPFKCLDSIFDNDESKIITDEGREILIDPEKMKQVKKQIKEQQKENPYGDIIINLD